MATTTTTTTGGAESAARNAALCTLTTYMRRLIAQVLVCFPCVLGVGPPPNVPRQIVRGTAASKEGYDKYVKALETLRTCGDDIM